MPTPCIHCKHPLNTTGACANCDANLEESATSSKSCETGETTTVSTTTTLSSTEIAIPARRARSLATPQRHPHCVNDPQIQITQQLQARSKLTALQPKPIRIALPRVLVRNPPRLRVIQSPSAGNSSTSQVTQQVQHQIRQRYRIQSPRQSINSSQSITKYRLIPKSDCEQPLNGCQEAEGIITTQPELLVGGGSSAINAPIRIITGTSDAHNTSPFATVVGTALNGSRSRVTQIVRTATPVTASCGISSQQSVKFIEPTESAAVSPSTPPVPLQFKVASSNGQTTPVYKILYSIPSQPAVAGLSPAQLTPLTLSNSQVVSSVLLTPSGTLQVFRHAANPSAQTQNKSSNHKQITHQSLAMMGPTRGRFLRSKALPSVASRLAIEPPPVVTIDDEDMGSNNSKDESETDGQEVVPFDYYKFTIVKQPDGIDKGEFRVRAQQLRIGSFLLRNRLVTFSRNNLRILARPVDSLTEEVELSFNYKEILKIVWAVCARTPAIIFNFSPGCGERIREALHMQYHEVVLQKLCDDAKHPYFEPKAEIERQRQVVIILGEPLSQEEYSLIQDCYMSPRGNVKREFAERLLELTEPNCRTPETPLLPQGGTRSPSLVQQDSPRSSVLLGSLVRKRKVDCPVPAKIVTSNGVVTVTSHTPSRDALTPIKLPPGVTFTNQTPICRYPPSGTGGIVIRAPDLLTLLPDSSVNDAVIDFYLSYIIGELLPKEKADKVFAFNTFFYSSLVKTPQKPVNTGIPEARRQHENVKRWTKGVDLFAKDFILIPVCENSHWFLIIVSYPWLVPKKHGIDLDSLKAEPGESTLAETPTKDSPDSSTGDSESVVILEAQKTPPREPPMQRRSDIKAGIFVFDSLRGHATSSKIFRLIRDYLAEEFLARKGVKCSFDWYSMRGYYPIAPQQTNCHDCGIFLLEYARKFLLDPPDPQALGANQMFNKMFDPDLIMQKGRWDIAEVMFQLSEKQFPELKGAPRIKYEDRIKVEGSTLGEEIDTPLLKRTRNGNTPK